MEDLSFQHTAPRARRRHQASWRSSAWSPPAIWKSWSSASCRMRECRLEIKTAAEGFGEVWEAVVADFVERHSPGGLQILHQ